MDTDKIIHNLSVLDALYYKSMQELINTYHFDEIRDVRVNIFKHCRIVIDSTYIFFLVRQDSLFEPDWWVRMIGRRLISEEMTEEQRSTFAFAFDSYTKSAYITMLLFGIESEFRSLYLAVFGKKAPFKFSEVYEELLHEFDLDNYKDLLKLASNIRNTLHNGGMYIWPDDTVPWRNVPYQFKQGQSLVLDYWETFIIITGDIFVMLDRLIKDERIIKKQTIVDSSYDQIS